MLARIIAVASGREAPDAVLKNCNVVDVFGMRVLRGDIAICGGKIAGVGDYSAYPGRDMAGAYVLPGFIDAHVHIESSMVTPAEYARAVMPHGVTAVVADPHEIANVCGLEGVRFMSESAKSSPLDVYFMAPSCVPATDFEHSGAELGTDEIAELLGWEGFLGLGEMMNYPGVISCQRDVLRKIGLARIVDGHAPGLSGLGLNAYAAAGIMTDHECVTQAEMMEKISKGLFVHIREGTLSKNLKSLLKDAEQSALARCAFCSDDRFVGDIVGGGTIDLCIDEAISLGIKPERAVAMASINAAMCYGLKGIGAVAPGYSADFAVCDRLGPGFSVLEVYKDGRLVAKDGEALFKTDQPSIPLSVAESVHLPEITPELFKYRPSGDFLAIRVLEGLITTKKSRRSHSDLSGLSLAAVIERHGKTGDIGLGFVENFGIKGGAIASTIGHDSHNLAVIGDNAADMSAAATALAGCGGISVAAGGRVSVLPLRVAGLMSDRPAEEVVAGHERLKEAAAGLGINPGIDPFMALAFLPLPVIPEIRLTDRGLFDVESFDFVG